MKSVQISEFKPPIACKPGPDQGNLLNFINLIMRTHIDQQDLRIINQHLNRDTVSNVNRYGMKPM